MELFVLLAEFGFHLFNQRLETLDQCLALRTGFPLLLRTLGAVGMDQGKMGSEVLGED